MSITFDEQKQYLKNSAELKINLSFQQHWKVILVYNSVFKMHNYNLWIECIYHFWQFFFYLLFAFLW